MLTSSVVAIFGDSLKDGHVYTEQDWPDDQKLFPYAKSKYLAEKFAWQFVRERREKNLDCFELAVINPGFVMVINRRLLYHILIETKLLFIISILRFSKYKDEKLSN